MEEKIKRLLTAVVHPETGQDIVTSGFIEHTAAANGKSRSSCASPKPAIRSQ